jgi:hypothetical protein
MWATYHHGMLRPQVTEGANFHTWMLIDAKFNYPSRIVDCRGNSSLALDESLDE